MTLNFLRRRVRNNNHLFNSQYIDPKALFVYYFDMLPNVSYITEVNMRDAYPFIRKAVDHEVRDCFQHSVFNYETNRTEFNVTFIVLQNKRIIEVGADYVAILHSGEYSGWAVEMLRKISAYRVKTTSNSRIGFATGHELKN